MRTRFAIAATALALASSCASAQVPDGTYAPAQTIAAAEERNVDDLPKAKLHLKLARDQMAKANALEQEGREKDAKLMMLMAQADADYALALLRNEDQQAETREVVARLEALRAEMGTETKEQ